MTPRIWNTRRGWLWLSLASFSTLVLLGVYEIRLVAPEIDRYFSQHDNVTGHQLATRSRVFVHEALDAVVNDDGAAATQKAAMSLEMAYSFLDISVYRDRYACTADALAILESSQRRLASSSPPAAEDMTRALLPVLECLTDIEVAQRVRRSETVTVFVEETRHHQLVLLAGILLTYLLGLLFWFFHERQRQATERASRESMLWMTKALQDPLTGVGNRNALHDHIAEASDETMGLVLVDIDHFKPYNDALGHPQGDRLLRQLVGLIELAMTGDARLYRVGGDEFAVLVPCDSPEALRRRCAELVAAVHREAIAHPGSPVASCVTLSVGGTWFRATGQCFEEAYAAADAALYEVKQQGRDGWRVAICPMQSLQGA